MADVSDLDLKALITTWEKNPNLLGFRDAVLSCLTELQARRAAEAAQPGEEEEVRKYLDEARDKFHVLGCNFAEASPERVCAFGLRDEAASLLSRLYRSKA